MEKRANISQDAIRFVLEPVTDIPPVEELWRRLDAAGSHSFFASWTWLGTWLRTIPWDFTPWLVRACIGDETIAAAFLVPRHERHGIGRVQQLHFNSTGEIDFDSITIEYTDFAGPGVNHPRLWQAFKEWFANYPQADELIVPGVAREDVAGMSTPGLLESTRRVPSFRVCALQSIAEAGIEARLSRNSRQQLRRSIRRYARRGPIVIEAADTVQTAQSYFSALKELHIRSWEGRGKPHAFRYPFFEAFHRALIARGIQSGSVQLLRVCAGDHAMGYLYNFRRGKRVYAYQSGFDDWAKGARPGYICHALAIQYNAIQGAEVYDFLAGDNRLKQSFADNCYPMSWCLYRHRNLRFKVEMLAWSAASRVSAFRPAPAAVRLTHPS